MPRLPIAPIVAALLLGVASRPAPTAAQGRVSVIPLPTSMTAGTGTFALTPTTVIVADAPVRAQARQLAAMLAPATGLDLEVRVGPAPSRISSHLQFQKHVLGVQGQLWTEYLPTPKAVEYLAFPRLIALAEVAWTPTAQRRLDDFRARLGPHLDRLRMLDVNYRPLDPQP